MAEYQWICHGHDWQDGRMMSWWELVPDLVVRHDQAASMGRDHAAIQTGIGGEIWWNVFMDLQAKI